MAPYLSIIIPHYNHADVLPTLLDCVAAQTYADYELIVVDDCSDQPCQGVVDAYANNGMNIRLVRNPCRQYTKMTRLNGVEAARGDYIAFFDADDRLAGTNALAAHMETLRREQADMLQFRVAIYSNGEIDRTVYERTGPLAARLSGGDIFAAYVNAGMFNHLVYGKIATRALWLECLEPARSMDIRRYQEDLLLASLLYLHAKSYIGSDRVGYLRDYIEKDRQKACGRAFSNYILITQFIAHAERHGLAPDLLPKIQAFFLRNLRSNLYTFLSNASNSTDEHAPERAIEEIDRHGTTEQFVKIILASRYFCAG